MDFIEVKQKRTCWKLLARLQLSSASRQSTGNLSIPQELHVFLLGMSKIEEEKSFRAWLLLVHGAFKPCDFFFAWFNQEALAAPANDISSSVRTCIWFFCSPLLGISLSE
jgi:hypothetical protein